MTYPELVQSFRDHLAPDGPIEEVCVTEIVNAAWRLRRCAEAAATLDISDPAHAALDRAQTHAHRTFERFLAELRRLQTARLVQESKNSPWPAFPTTVNWSALSTPPRDYE